MTAEADFIRALRALPLHAGARDLRDDAAVLGDLVLTHDAMVEGVHWPAGAPGGDVGWKLVAVNLSDLAAKGAMPEGVLLGFPLGDAAWDEAFVAGFGEALTAFGVPLLGGDTVSAPPGAPRVVGLTAVGRSPRAPDRRGARAGDELWVCGTVGDAVEGLRIALGERDGPDVLLRAYRRPVPLLAEGRELARHASAMADVSDGLLIDAGRIAEASGLSLAIDLDAVPRSETLRADRGDGRAARLAAAKGGDDYALVLAAPPSAAAAVAATGAARVGRFAAGAGLTLHDRDGPVPLPAPLGWEHGRG